MRFRTRLLSVCTVLAFVGCQDRSGEVTVAVDEPMSIDELNDLAQNAAFVGELPSGQTIDFNPQEIFPSNDGNQFSNLPETNYSRSPDPFEFDLTSLSSVGILEFTFEESNVRFEVFFQYVFITSYAELEFLYPDFFDVSEEFEDWVVVYAFGDGTYDIDDLFNGEVFGVTDYLVVTGNPSGDLFGSYYSEGSSFDEWYTLDGLYELNTNRITSNGDLYLESYINNFYTRTYFGPYTFELVE